MGTGVVSQFLWEYFLDKLNFFKEKNKYSLHAYCLMSNRVHLLLQEVEDEISTSIKRICSSYVLWYNSKYERCGHLFQERFKSEVVESDDYFLKTATGLVIMGI